MKDICNLEGVLWWLSVQQLAGYEIEWEWEIESMWEANEWDTERELVAQIC